MGISKGLIIAEPWISKILAGEKIWEMRSKSTKFRGSFALIRKGSGVVVGVADLIDVSGEHDVGSLSKTHDMHCIGENLYGHADYKWWYAWKLASVVTLFPPIKYRHNNGAVTWVSLDEAAIKSISRQVNFVQTDTNSVTAVANAEMARLFGDDEINDAATKRSKEGSYGRVANDGIEIDEGNDQVAGRRSAPTSSTGSSRADYSKNIDPYENDSLVETSSAIQESDGLRITLTQGNINNSHFYIPIQSTIFPASAWGGKNKDLAGVPIDIELQGMAGTLATDIDGNKRILRNRRSIKAFYKFNNVQSGDVLSIARLSEGKYRIRVAK